ncbi:hypothetical protein LCGC14_0920160 [marine sediment metagenome]|uniref:Uncharacterized protein n=1 Tax=marine sediment metagenome TaxID=412755 RepID=A0A0F9R9S9_9ZZZZ
MRYIYWLIQMIFMFALVVPIRFLRSIPHRVDRMAIGLYYWACVRRRRAAGEDTWKEMDLSIGKHPPPEHPWWDGKSIGGFSNTIRDADGAVIDVRDVNLDDPTNHVAAPVPGCCTACGWGGPLSTETPGDCPGCGVTWNT